MNTASPNQGRLTGLSGIRSNVLAGLTSSFALVPECIAFALVAHLNPLMSLYGAFFICTITALFGGRPGMISGAAGSMAVGFDVVVDNVGGATLDASFAVVRHFGHVVSALGWGTHALAPLSFREATYSGVFTLHALLTGQGRAHHGEMLRVAAQLAEEGKLAPRLDARRFDLASAESAYVALSDGSARGKIVVDVA